MLTAETEIAGRRITDQLAEIPWVRQLGTPRLLGPGIHRDILSEDYHANPGASNSRLMDLAQSPAHAKYRMENPEDPTQALIIGDATHILTLQGDAEFARRYVVSDQCAARKEKGGRCANPGKWLVGGEWLCGIHCKSSRFGQAFDAAGDSVIARGFRLRHTSVSEDGRRQSLYFEDGNGHHVRVSDHAPNQKTRAWILRENVQSVRVDLPPFGMDDSRRVLSQDDYDQCRRMRDAVMGHTAARAILESSDDREISATWTCRRTGVKCKMRADAMSAKKTFIADLKTTIDASRKKFMRVIQDRGYHFQAALYQDGAATLGQPIDDFALIAVEKDAPHGVAVYRIKDDLIERAMAEQVRRLEKWGECERTGVWPSYDDGIQDISLTDWAMRELEQL